jgi:hypothetical protein
MASVSGLTRELEKLWEVIHFRHSDKIGKDVLIVVGSDALVNRPKYVPMMVSAGSVPEIYICWHELQREDIDPGHAAVVHLLHAAAHVYCAKRGIQELSKGDHYHNAKFRMACEEFGLVASYSDSSHGYTDIKISGETLIQYETSMNRIMKFLYDSEFLYDSDSYVPVGGHVR